MLRSTIEVALALLTLCGLAFSVLALWSARQFLLTRKHQSAADLLPPVSILKPLKGADSETYSALRSHCLQNYGPYEILFGVNDDSDDAVPLVRRLMTEFPNLGMRLIVCSEVFGANRKVSNLVHLLRHARYSHVLVNDGDITVGQEYLRGVMSEFKNPETGMVTCLYRGTPAKTLGSKLEALGIASDFIPGVLTANYLERSLRFGLGSTLAMSRTALDRIGGFAAVVDYLADDYQLGERISAAGFEVTLASEVVETHVPPYSFSDFWKHQLRWTRTMRVSRPGGYLGLALTFALPWSIFLLLTTPHMWWAWILLIVALTGRATQALTVGKKVLGDPHLMNNLWLLPLRDLLGLAIWCWSFAGNEVTWRGETFRLSEGKLLPVVSEERRDAGTGSENLESIHRR
jgi:ceramide glucosyltransferase